MNKLIVAKVTGIVVISLGMVVANTTSMLASTNALANSLGIENGNGTGGYQSINADPVVVGAGDIANCGVQQDTYTAALLGKIDGDVITFGDNTQVNGTAEEFTDCYDPTWGLYKYKTHPSPGNHDYRTLGALPYYNYFGSAAGDVGKGYYSYDIGYWHLIALNSEVDISSVSAQVQWLQADLDSHHNKCTLAYWHRPRFTSGLSHPSDPAIGAIWEILYKYGVDIVLNGHVHLYERFAPQNPLGVADSKGIREFVVGTGGGGSLVGYSPVANSEVINNKTYGVIKLTLHKNGYDWEFIPIEGQTFTDYGSSDCVVRMLNTFLPLIRK
jgi:acid phosphatase type 7